jgi:putative lipase involved disintegration of autophagic bodies
MSDWVIDLQYVPQSLEDVGELCGFNGAGHLCHKGVLTRCKWMYNDIKRREIIDIYVFSFYCYPICIFLTICFACCHFRSRVLKHLYSDESVYKDYDLVVVGHSLGGGCAQVLSLMLRPSFPSLRCFAYEPPVRLFSF